MILPLVITSCSISVATLILLIVFRPRPNNNLFALSYKLDDLLKKLDGISVQLKEDFRLNREELNQSAAANRQELNTSLYQFKGEMTETLKLMTDTNRVFSENIHRTLEEKITALIQKVEVNNQSNRQTITTALKDFSSEQNAKLETLRATQREHSLQITIELEKINRKVEEKLLLLNEQVKGDQHLARQTMDASFKGFNENFDKNVSSFNQVLREKFGQLEDKQRLLVESTEKKLDGIRETVDEKLQKTLNERLGQSFELVRQQLESVQKGLGEMQTLAQDVGGLKKVLSNVKMRGGFGEVQLHMLLENILAPEQYESNVATKKGSSERVEFAIKFPNKEAERDFVWLPIDAKFPKDAYETLQNAHDIGDLAAIEAAQRALEATVKRMAKDICEKYLDAPHTTNFGILFLPFEGLFAEIVRKASLLEEIQRDCHVIITGPTTLAVILNSLQMGFRTLAIQKRSAEVWQVLGAVKKEFGQFGGLLQKAQNNIQTGLNQLDNVMGVRTRAIQRQLKEVEVLASDEEQGRLQAARQELSS